jgi:hypothetical protein
MLLNAPFAGDVDVERDEGRRIWERLTRVLVLQYDPVELADHCCLRQGHRGQRLRCWGLAIRPALTTAAVVPKSSCELRLVATEECRAPKEASTNEPGSGRASRTPRSRAAESARVKDFRPDASRLMASRALFRGRHAPDAEELVAGLEAVGERLGVVERVTSDKPYLRED